MTLGTIALADCWLSVLVCGKVVVGERMMNSSQESLPGETLLYDCSSSYRLANVFDRIIRTGEITAADRSIFLITLFNPSVSAEELSVIDRLCYLVRQGQIKIVDETNFPDLGCKTKPPKLSIISKEKKSEHPWKTVRKRPSQVLTDNVEIPRRQLFQTSC